MISMSPELDSLYRPPNTVRVIKSRRSTWAKWKKVRSALKILTGKPTGKNILGRPMHKWQGNIRMDLK